LTDAIQGIPFDRHFGQEFESVTFDKVRAAVLLGDATQPDVTAPVLQRFGLADAYRKQTAAAVEGIRERVDALART
jgi:hypothetical protein